MSTSKEPALLHVTIITTLLTPPLPSRMPVTNPGELSQKPKSAIVREEGYERVGILLLLLFFSIILPTPTPHITCLTISAKPCASSAPNGANSITTCHDSDGQATDTPNAGGLCTRTCSTGYEFSADVLSQDFQCHEAGETYPSVPGCTGGKGGKFGSFYANYLQ